MSIQPTPAYADLARLARIISWVETKNSIRAMRFERRVFNKVTNLPYGPVLTAITAAHNNAISNDTARALYSMSFGVYQIMGFNLWGSLGYKRDMYTFLSSTEDQYEMFAELIKRDGIYYSIDDLKNNKDKRTSFAIKYNGAASYGDLILSAIQHLGF